MGGDGGVIATSRKFLRGAKTEEKEEGKNLKRNQLTRTRACAQSGTKLRHPIVVCEMGNMYNKEEIITALINKTLNPSFSHIRGLKDVKDAIFFENSQYAESREIDGECQSLYVCPVTFMEFNGISPFVIVWTTGFVLAEKAIREMGIDALQAEYGPFKASDIVRLLPLEEDIPSQIANMHHRRARTKKDKKDSKKRDHDDLSVVVAVGVSATSSSSSTVPRQTSNDDNAHQPSDSEYRHAMPRHDALEVGPEVTLKKAKVSDVHRSDGSVVGQASSSGGLSTAAVTVKTVNETVKKREEVSSVFKGLFHKGLSADKHDRDLFMSVAGLRYTIS